MPVNILVVDDEPDLELLIRQKFRKRIRRGELEFSFAHDGVEALERLDHDAEIDIVLSDINMPRMDGLSLLGKLQELEDRLLKVVIVSAYGDMDNIRTAMNRGAFDFVTKPIDFGDLETTIEKTNRELEELRQAVRLRRQLGALQRELDIASKIQLSMLPDPNAFPTRDDVALHARTDPAREVGGDFYDYFLIDDHRLGFVVGDVSGKGVGAALFMAITRTMLRATALQGHDVAACVRHVNRVLFPESMPQMFVTVVYGELDARDGHLTYCAAGHLPPVVLRNDGRTDLLEHRGGPGLCLVDDFDFTTDVSILAPGERLLLYSDGVTEATNPSGEQFDAHLLHHLATVDGQRPPELVRHLVDAVHTFAADAEQADDITLLALQYH